LSTSDGSRAESCDEAISLEERSWCILKQQAHANEQRKVSKRVEKQQCSKVEKCSYLKRRGIAIPLQGHWHYG
jgi:hypothetical protein